MKFHPRVVSWRLMGALVALLFVLHLLVHRVRAGTWSWAAEEWVPTYLGTVVGALLARALFVWLVRRQRTRNRPST